MQSLRILSVLGLLLVLAACGGGKFMPVPGPFTGVLTTATGPVGQFSFTTTDGLLGGTGTLTVGGNQVPVSITALISGTTIDGDITNVNLGSGDFKGNFIAANIATGTFTYVDSAETVHLTGTWQANL